MNLGGREVGRIWESIKIRKINIKEIQRVRESIIYECKQTI